MQLYFGYILFACWAVFIGYWLYSATKAKRTVRRSFYGTGMLWRLSVVVIVVVIAKLYPQFLSRSFVAFNPWWGVLGCVLAIAGVAIAVWARYHLGRNWGMPMTLKENAELVTSGPYHWVRNPIYSGAILALLGSGLVGGAFWLFVCLTSVIYFVASVFQEEKLMQKEFPNTYPAYKARTWRLLPFIF